MPLIYNIYYNIYAINSFVYKQTSEISLPLSSEFSSSSIIHQLFSATKHRKRRELFYECSR